MALKDELEASKLENERLKKKLEISKGNFETINEKFLGLKENNIKIRKDIEMLEEIPKHRLIKLLNKELDATRFTTEFLSGIELLTRSIKNLGGGD